MLNNNLKILKGDLAVDDRGSVRFVNDFNFLNVKRFYQIENHNTEIIRAFHGHLKEGKYVYVCSGSILLCAVPINKTKNPNKKAIVEKFVLSALKPTVVFIPPGFANGFKTLENNTKVIFFSTSTVEESRNDDYRFPHDYWGNHIWEVEYR